MSFTILGSWAFLNINVAFTNNSNVAIDLLIFTFYSDQLVIDVKTGIVN